MTELPYSDDEIVRTLYSPVLSDTLDAMGYRNQAMRPFVRPLDESLVLFGSSPARAQAAPPGGHEDDAFDFMNVLSDHDLHDIHDESWNAGP